ncbi:hypothetical protein JI752_006835 [Lysobacter sp. MMG2]|uniref:hypothetical protein n=1 Tax=Lysobacter sp. MMG2 TaxID=2801338 RepID=UPI001C216D69|nr:hypothetical protein [Lysobacter sp. MMG2]MBU8975855.1 hypothetical protein [Lysobacter sp. MMG2]
MTQQPRPPKKKARGGKPGVGQAAEVATFRESLERSGQVQDDEDLKPGVTHVRKRDDEGGEVLVRRRFSALAPKK